MISLLPSQAEHRTNGRCVSHALTAEQPQTPGQRGGGGPELADLLRGLGYQAALPLS